MTETLSFDTVHPVDIAIKDLSISVKPPAKSKFTFGKKPPQEALPIIKDVSATVKSGLLLAIIGGSGSGKTTLLNALAGRAGGLQQDGDILFNGRSPKRFISRGLTGYVQQTDHLMPYLTVRETLQYAAELRLPTSMSTAKKHSLVEQVILELGLKECAGTVVGNEWRKGISGGEKRRVTIGCQLLTNPSVLSLDEPTTGLDSFTARHLVSTLVNLARRGRTVVMSIHQPRSDIFKMFDGIILLSRGNVVYSGPTLDVVKYFEDLGYPCPPMVNPGDHLIDISSVDNRTPEREVITKARVLTLTEAWTKKQESQREEILKAEESDPTTTLSKVEKVNRIKTPGFIPQCFILSRRALTNISRDGMQQWGNLTGAVSIAVVLGLVFLRLPISQVSAVQSLKTITYIFAVMRYYLGMILWVYKLSVDLNVFDREREDKMYSVPSYLIADFISQLPANIIYPTIYAVIIYFLVGLRTDDLASHILIFIATNILMQLCTIGYAYVCVSLAPGRSFATASLIGNAMSIFFFLTAGYVLNYNDIPVYIRWFRYINYYAYAYHVAVLNELRNRILPCINISPQCNGNVALSSVGISPTQGLPVYFGALIAWYVVAMAIACIVLMIYHPGGVKHASNLADRRKEANEEAVVVNDATEKQAIKEEEPINTRRCVDVELQGVALNVTKSGIPLLRKPQDIPILRNVHAKFPAGQVSVIMGGSGAGKSSLLHVLSSRPFSAGPFADFKSTGSITFNGRPVTPQRIRAECAFVQQDDQYHLAALTVRETLRYAALLRLPTKMSKERKYARAEEVLNMLGLKDCADIVVGGEFLKGISGGEKRRLSLAVQMIGDPNILVIDEPTSGLDAFIAMGIMTTLKELANSGRTIICSIHQPRSDIFDQAFDNILLLTRGGRVAYSGRAKEVLPHFSKLGLECPTLFNPADFLIDETSIDLRNADAEKVTTERVEKVLENWNKIQADGGPTQSPELEENRADSSEDSTAASADVGDLEKNQRTIAQEKAEDNMRIRITPMRIALPVLLDRSLRNMWRQKDTFFARLTQTPTLAISLWIFYLRLNHSATGAQNRIGLIQENVSTLFVGMLNAVAIFPQERNLFYHEYVSSPYSASTFLLAFLMVELPFEIFASLLYSVIVNVGFNMQTSPRIFFEFFLTILALTNAGESVGIAFAAIFEDVGLSVNLISTALSLMVNMSGIVSANVPQWLSDINFVSVTKYAAQVQAINEFKGLEIQCSQGEISSGVCVAQNGEQLLQIFNFNPDSLGLFIGLLVAVTVAYRAIAWWVLIARMKIATK